MVSGIGGRTPKEVKLFYARQKVKLERGDLEYADTYFLSKLILYGNKNEKLVANAEWKRRTGKKFPYHPSFEGDRYPHEVEASLKNYANEMQNLTTYSNDTIIVAESILNTFTKIGTETFPEALEAGMNMSALFGQDLKQSMVQLGTALNDPIAGVGRLRRIGISFTEEQKKSIQTFMDQNDVMSAQRVILDELNAELGGVARAMGETFAGRTAQMKNAVDDLKKT